MIKETVLIISCIGIAICQDSEIDLCLENHETLKFAKLQSYGYQERKVMFREKNCSWNCSQLLFRMDDNKLPRESRDSALLQISGKNIRTRRNDFCYLFYSTRCLKVQKWILNHHCNTVKLMRTARLFPLTVFFKTNSSSYYVNMRYNYVTEDTTTTGSPISETATYKATSTMKSASLHIKETTSYQVPSTFKSNAVRRLEQEAQQDKITIIVLAVTSGIMFLTILFLGFRLCHVRSHSTPKTPLQSIESTYAEIQGASSEPQTVQNREVFNGDNEVVDNELYGMKY